MSAEFTEIDYARSGCVARLRLGCPKNDGGELTPTALRELHRALDLVEQDEHVRFLVVTGAGRNFYAGLDPDYARRTAALEDGCDRLIEEFLRPFVDFVTRLDTIAEYVIAAVNGPCSAAGLWIVRACHFAVGPEPASTFAERVEDLIDSLSSARLGRPASRARPPDPSPAPSPRPSAVR